MFLICNQVSKWFLHKTLSKPQIKRNIPHWVGPLKFPGILSCKVVHPGPGQPRRGQVASQCGSRIVIDLMVESIYLSARAL